MDSRLWGIDALIHDYNGNIGNRFGANVISGAKPTFSASEVLLDPSSIENMLRNFQTSGFYAILHMAQYVAANPNLSQADRREVWGHLGEHLKVVAQVSQKLGLNFERAIWNASFVLATQTLTFNDMEYHERFMAVCMPSENGFWDDANKIMRMTEARARDLDTMAVGFSLTLAVSRAEKYRQFWDSGRHPLGLKVLHSRMNEIKILEFIKKLSEIGKARGLPPYSDEALRARLVGDLSYALFAPTVRDIVSRA